MHLLSGGLDSTVLLYDLCAKRQTNIHCLLFDYGQRHLQELQFAKIHVYRLSLLYTVINVPQLKGSELTDGAGGAVVPCRNAIFLSLACNLAASLGAGIVTFAANQTDAQNFPDCRQDFITAFNSMLKTAELPVEVRTPYIDKPKWWIAGLGRELGVKAEETWSCYRGGIRPCGECEACKKREEALKKQ